MVSRSVVMVSRSCSPIAMLWGLAKLIGGRASPSELVGGWCPAHVLAVCRWLCFDGVWVM